MLDIVYTVNVLPKVFGIYSSFGNKLILKVFIILSTNKLFSNYLTWIFASNIIYKFFIVPKDSGKDFNSKL